MNELRRHGLTLVLLMGACTPKSSPIPPPPEVVVITVTAEDIPSYFELVGTVDGMVNADIRARVPGYIKSQVYREGAFVKEGDLLFTLDAVLSQASTTRAVGELEAAKAALAKTTLDVSRLRPLQAAGTVSRQDLDNALAAQEAAHANLIAAEGTVQGAQASVSFSRVTSPITGLAGTARVRIGSLVGQGEPTLLTTISQIDQVRVVFPISEQAYLANAERIRRIEADREEVPLDLVLADGSQYPHKGRVAYVERQADVTTGTVNVVATFPNPNFVLRPGLYAKVRGLRAIRKGAIAVPQRAVEELQGEYHVDVVGPDDKVEVRTVVVGERTGSRWIIDRGLAPGEHVILEGLQKVRNQAQVRARMASAAASAVAR